MNELTQAEVEARIDSFGAALAERLGERLVGALVYGSLAKGDYCAGASDHNLALLLADDRAQTLRSLAEVMRAARPSRRTTLLLLTREELERARDVFPLKLRDLARHHRLVVGSAAGLREASLCPTDLARDCEQQLRSLAIRSRRLFLRGTSDPELLRHNLTIVYKALLPPLAGLVELCAGREPVLHSEVLAEGCELLGADPEPLRELHRWQRHPEQSAAESRFNPVLDATLDLLRAAASRADAIHEAHARQAAGAVRAEADPEPRPEPGAGAESQPEPAAGGETGASGTAGAEGA